MDFDTLWRRKLDAVAAMDRTSANFLRELHRVFLEIERGLRDLVAEVTDDLARRKPTAALVQAAQRGKLRAQIRALLTEAGLGDLFDAATGAPLDALAQKVLAVPLGQDAARFLGELAPKVDALKALVLADLVGGEDVLAQDLWRTTIRGVFTGRTEPDLLADLASRLDKSVPQTRTLYDTSLSIYGREVEALTTTGADDEAFVYFGPLDKVTRPFCQKWVGQVLTRDRIDGLDNGQLPNVFLTGGGYNCRHSWLALSVYDAARKFVNTGQRLPEFAGRAAA